MAKTKTSFSEGNQPARRRGRGKQALILEAIKEKALLGLSKDSSNDDAEKAVFSFLAESAFNPTADTAVVSNTSLNHIMKKGWPDIKPVMPSVEFTLNSKDPHGQAMEIIKAVSDGTLAPDVANTLITSLSSMLKIEEMTELKDKVDELQKAMEKLLNES